MDFFKYSFGRTTAAKGVFLKNIFKMSPRVISETLRILLKEQSEKLE